MGSVFAGAVTKLGLGLLLIGTELDFGQQYWSDGVNRLRPQYAADVRERGLRADAAPIQIGMAGCR